MKTNLLLVDDHTTYRQTLKDCLNNVPGFKVAGECDDGSEVIPFVSSHDIDVVIMDINMKDLDGISATGQLKQHNPDIEIILHSSFDSIVWREVAQMAGAAGFVSKTEPTETLVREIERLSKTQQIPA